MMKKAILIVEDEPDIREALGYFLESFGGFDVFLASGGIEALAILSKKTVDLVISDVRMPNGDGLFLIQNLKDQISLGLKFVFMTGYSDFSRSEALTYGASEVFHKPFDLTEVEHYLQIAFK